MALHEKQDRNGLIRSRDLRVCTFYAKWLNVNSEINTRNVPRQDVESCRRELNLLINRAIPDKAKQTRLLSDMEIGREENILLQESFDWVRMDERAAFWLWAYLCETRDSLLEIDSPSTPELTNWYQRLNLSVSPVSHSERVNLIVTFFDSIIIPAPPVKYVKKKVMEKLKDQWRVIYNKPLPLKWLPDEEDAVLWAWNNLQKVQRDNPLGISRSLMRRNASGLTTWFTPFNHAERNLALRAALDLWDGTQDTKRLFLLNLNKAWNQQKLRQSRTDKKALNTYLKNETKNRLDLMAERSGVRISDMLEKLINEHYRKMIGGE
ncbi:MULTISPECIES: hypothetical protein [Klebsiella]|uniref:hypothetical protein n=1 Tax=Klebsiella TaxID=570 RepID=UPI00053895D4|nr:MULTISPECIES: hypothetical protein [Klebsiella]MDS7730097.1 hypothetical protein [Klebsiella oxytoca]MDS7804586.1 hypothetical protein [Klebsiella oxytoca]MDS7863106.1 hypothetical protein [Klebsiella oxytoca]OZS15404.1 hypothetical protein CIG58_29240 [Klebsiella oxytoca]PNO43217.1 hypothetical protein MC52_011930 [Klebsiella michiganensis]